MQVCRASRRVGLVPGRVGGVSGELVDVLLARGGTQEAWTWSV